MSKLTSSKLKSQFQTGFKPTERNFANLIDATVNKADADVSIDEDTQFVGLGPIYHNDGTYPAERLHLNGAIVLGMSQNNVPGTIRWNRESQAFQCYDGKGWKSLIVGAKANKGENGNPSHIDSSLGIGVETPQAQLHISGGLILGNTNAKVPGTLRWNDGDLEVFKDDSWLSLTQGRADTPPDPEESRLIIEEDPDHTRPDALPATCYAGMVWIGQGDAGRYCFVNTSYNRIRFLDHKFYPTRPPFYNLQDNASGRGGVTWDAERKQLWFGLRRDNVNYLSCYQFADAKLTFLREHHVQGIDCIKEIEYAEDKIYYVCDQTLYAYGIGEDDLLASDAPAIAKDEFPLLSAEAIAYDGRKYLWITAEGQTAHQVDLEGNIVFSVPTEEISPNLKITGWTFNGEDHIAFSSSAKTIYKLHPIKPKKRKPQPDTPPQTPQPEQPPPVNVETPPAPDGPLIIRPKDTPDASIFFQIKKGKKKPFDGELTYKEGLGFYLLAKDKLLLALTEDGSVGIGTEKPSEKLTVEGSIAFSESLVFPKAFGQSLRLFGPEYGIGIQTETQYFRSTKNFAWYKGGEHSDDELDPGGGEPMMVIADGKVGIGTAKPTEALTVEGSIAFTEGLVFPDKPSQSLQLKGADYGIGIQAETQYFRSGKNFAWYKGGEHSDDELDPGGGEPVMVIKDGNVGIGTEDPKVALDVEGEFHIKGDKPFYLVKFEKVKQNFNTHYSVEEWTAVLAGFDSGGGSLNTANTGKESMLKVHLKVKDNTWYIDANVWTKHTHDIWTIWILFIRNELVANFCLD